MPNDSIKLRIGSFWLNADSNVGSEVNIFKTLLIKRYIRHPFLFGEGVWRSLFECDKRLEWVYQSPVGNKWVMINPYEPLKFEINEPLPRIWGCMCSQNLLITSVKYLYFYEPTSFVHNDLHTSVKNEDFDVQWMTKKWRILKFIRPERQCT